MTIPTRLVHLAARARLIELADGAEPAYDANGICYDIEATLLDTLGEGSPDGYAYCSRVFEGMGLDEDLPLGSASYDPDNPKWVGDWGVKRRNLARQMATYIEENYLQGVDE